MTNLPPFAPVIASIGDPPERHAVRIVRDMLTWAIHERQRLDDALAQAIGTTRSSLRNPTAQLRFVERIRRARPSAVIAVKATTGKREFLLELVCWEVVDPDTLAALSPGDAPSDRLWLGCCAHLLAFGRDQRSDVKQKLIVALSFHALVNLCVRLKARSLDDLIAGLRQLWAALEPRLREPKLAGASFLAPIGDGGSAVIEWSGELRTYVCKTALSGDMALPTLPLVGANGPLSARGQAMRPRRSAEAWSQAPLETFYGSWRWRVRARAQLKRQPLCETCLAQTPERVTIAVVANHTRPWRTWEEFINCPLTSVCWDHNLDPRFKPRSHSLAADPRTGFPADRKHPFWRGSLG